MRRRWRLGHLRRVVRGLRALPVCAETFAGFVDAMAATRAPATVRRDLASIARAQPGSHLTDPQHPWHHIRARAKLDSVCIHNFRHSFASRALALGEGLPMIGKLLGHTQV